MPKWLKRLLRIECNPISSSNIPNIAQHNIRNAYLGLIHERKQLLRAVSQYASKSDGHIRRIELAIRGANGSED